VAESLNHGQLDALRADADRFIAELDEEAYLHFAGHKESYDLVPIYERHAELTRLETVQAIGASVDGGRNARELWRFACEGYLGNFVREGSERVAELEAKLGVPPKTPDNSSVPPSKGQKPSESSTPKDKAKPHAGAHRPLHPNPTAKRDVFACRCQGCGADVSGVAQNPCEAYDRVEIPQIKPDVTRVTLHGGVCPCCAKRFRAEPPEGLEPGSPFGANLRALVIYLRSVQGIPLARLSHVLCDLFGLDISEGALVNILAASQKPFAAQTSLIKARLMAGAALASDRPA